MRITELSLRRPITIIMLFISLSAFGIISARLLPLEQFPEIQYPGSFILVPYQGSSPEEVERLITRPIEEALATLSNIERMQSTSRRDGAEIGLFFGWNTDAAIKGMEVMDKIDSIRHLLPDDVERIFVFRGSTSDEPILVLRLSSEQVDLASAYELLNRHLKQRLERLDGVSQARLEGVEPWEIRIELLPERLAAHNLSVIEVMQVLERANFSMTAGEITSNGQRLRVRPEGEFRSIDDVRNLPIRANLRVSDIAEVIYTTRERSYGRSLDQTYAIGLSIMKDTGANMVEVSDRVLAEIEEISRLPEMQGIRIFFLNNAADDVRQSLSDLLSSGIIGALLSIVVLYLFVRHLGLTLAVTLAVPFSLTITLAVMYFAGITLNILSMMGLMLAIGMLVDNAVVVAENILRCRQHVPDVRKATLMGAQEVAPAVTAGTLTSIIVFLPMVFGEKIDITVFLEQVAITIIVSLLASLFISLTIIPMVVSRLALPRERPDSWMSRVHGVYDRFLPWSLRHRGLMFMLALGVMIAGVVVIASPLVNTEMFPEEDSRRLFMRYNLDGTYSLERVERAVNEVEAYLYAHQDEFEIDSVYSYYDNGRAESTILLRDADKGGRKATAEIRDAIREGLPEIVIGKPSFGYNQGGTQDGVSIQLSGESSEVLFELSHDVARVLSSIEGLTDVRPEATGGDREIRVSVDRERATAFGLSTEEVARSIAVAMRGHNLREFRAPTGEVDVILSFSGQREQRISDLENIPLLTQQGQRITLSTIADFEIVRGPARITRYDRTTAVRLNAGLTDGTTMEAVQPKIKELMEAMHLPAGYDWKFGEGFDRNEQAENLMLQNMLLAVLLILIVMASVFEAVLQPIGILLGIVFSITGVFFFFALTGTTFSFMAMIGILILMGVVVNNGIVMVDHINLLRRQGVPRLEAIRRGCSDRLRPVIMTVTTTVVGLAPLAVSTTQIGGQGPAYFPMARAIIGGLLFSTFITLLVLPAMYVLLDDLGRWGPRVWRKAAGRTAEATT
ncbi:MAG TPA: efflux RND transporter permease subunit [Gammaproteobacteria bacterium]|nr:efflux RND transporter permease subunit [Gammaproteobacteria bacterium]